MLQTSRGIVLQQIKYSETALIVKIYTAGAGLKSFMIHGARKKNAKIRPIHLQHLSLVEIVFNNRDNAGLQHLRELSPVYSFTGIPFDIRKSSVALFINELILKSVREEEPNQHLFDFLFHSIQLLDTTHENTANFHLLFAVKLTRYLGFYPSGEYSEATPLFNLGEGVFCNMNSLPESFLDNASAKLLDVLIRCDYSNFGTLSIEKKQRQYLLAGIVSYYKNHIAGFGELKSLSVLTEVMS
jgi:DNA repair protein RecO (recombination protein O)